MGMDTINTEELKLGDRLAVERTLFAADRTLLAWVRTSMSMIGFGFTIYKVLEYIYQEGATRIIREQTPRNIGLFMILTGTVPLLLMMIQYTRTLKQMGRGKHIFLNPNLLTAGVIFLLGLLLMTAISLNIVLL